MLFFKKIVSTNRQGAELHFRRWVAAHILCSKAHKQKRGSSAKRKPLFYTHQNKTERHPNGFLYPWGCLLSYCVFALCRLPQPTLSPCYNSSIGKTRIKMQTFRIIAKNPSHENAASKLVLAPVRFFILAVLIRFKQHSAPPYETTFLPFFSSPLSTRGCAMI